MWSQEPTKEDERTEVLWPHSRQDVLAHTREKTKDPLCYNEETLEEKLRWCEEHPDQKCDLVCGQKKQRTSVSLLPEPANLFGNRWQEMDKFCGFHALANLMELDETFYSRTKALFHGGERLRPVARVLFALPGNHYVHDKLATQEQIGKVGKFAVMSAHHCFSVNGEWVFDTCSSHPQAVHWSQRNLIGVGNIDDFYAVRK
jgi:hypothetical protein